jgi:thiamine kinase-like enzyme
MSSGTALRDNVFSLLQTLQIPQTCPWPLRSSEQISLQRLGGAMTNLMFIVSIHSEPMKDIPSKSTSLSRGSTADSSISLSKENTISNGISSNSVNSACSASSVHSDQFKTIKVLLRIYGHGTEQFFSRERELYIIQVFSSMNIGPKLLGMFGNGRFEEYMDSDTLTSHDVRLPGISREIARKLYDIHSLVGIVKMDGVEEEMSANGESWSMGRYHSVPKYPSELWDRIYDWYEKALDAISQLLQQDACSHAERLRELRLETFIGEIRQLEKKLNALDSPVVFAHNDVSLILLVRHIQYNVDAIWKRSSDTPLW